MGYEQNPLSLYYCYDLEGSTKVLKKCIAEVCVFYVELAPNWKILLKFKMQLV